MNVPPTAFAASRAQSLSWWRFLAFWTLVGFVVITCSAVGAVFGWVKYFSDDGFAPQFALAEEQNAALQDAIDAEATARKAADTSLTEAQAATLAALNAEIATRTAEDALLLAMVNAEIAARTAAQQALNSSLTLEIITREAFDTLAFEELANLTIRLNALTAYNVFAEQEFIAVYTNLTLLEAALAAETAARIASENVLAAQDLAQQTFIATFAAELAAETATRTAEGETQLAEIAAFLGDGILTINNQSALNHNFDFISANAGFTIGSGGTNIITLANHAVATIDSLTPAPGTFDISITAGNNVVVTPGVHQITVGLINIPLAPNYASYHGNWAASSSGTCLMDATEWIFDANGIASCLAPSPFIRDYNTYNGYGWEVPTSGGVGYGIWLVRVRMTLTVNYLGTPFGIALTMGLCVNTRAACIANPAANNPRASLVWQMAPPYATAIIADWGLNYQDHIMSGAYVLDGRGLAAFTGVYPVWYQYQGLDGFVVPGIQAFWLYAISVEYDVTQLA